MGHHWTEFQLILLFKTDVFASHYCTPHARDKT